MRYAFFRLQAFVWSQALAVNLFNEQLVACFPNPLLVVRQMTTRGDVIASHVGIGARDNHGRSPGHRGPADGARRKRKDLLVMQRCRVFKDPETRVVGQLPADQLARPVQCRSKRSAISVIFMRIVRRRAPCLGTIL